MKKIFILISIIACMLITSVLPATAADTMQDDALKIEYSSVTFGDVKLSGTFPGKMTNRIASIFLLKGNLSLPEITELSDDDFEHIGMARVSYEGSWEYSFNFNGDSGDYTYIAICNDDRIEEYQKILKPTDQDEFIEDLREGTLTAEQVKSFISQYGDKFGLDMSKFNTDNKLTMLAEELVGGKSLIVEKDFAAFAELQAVALKKVNVIDTIKNSYLTTEIYSALYNNNDVLGIDFTKYNNLSTENKDAVLNAMLGNEYALNKIKPTFDELVSDYSSSKGSGSGSRDRGKGGGYYGDSSALKTDDVQQTAPGANGQFNDMAAAQWASSAVEYLCGKGVISGYNGSFYPNNTVKREEFVKMIVLAFNLYDENADVDFRDVNKDDWCYPYIASAVKSGLINGMAEGTFGTGIEITRQDIAVILERALENISVSEEKAFNDEDEISDYAKDAVKNLSGAGIINGMPDGSFAPKSNATRAEAATLIYKAVQ